MPKLLPNVKITVCFRVLSLCSYWIGEEIMVGNSDSVLKFGAIAPTQSFCPAHIK